MEARNFCQSCGMPVDGSHLLGTENDGSPSKEFCTYCYQKGEFTQDVTMGEMVATCIPHMVDAGMPEGEARTLLESTLPNLSRWTKG